MSLERHVAHHSSEDEPQGHISIGARPNNTCLGGSLWELYQLYIYIHRVCTYKCYILNGGPRNPNKYGSKPNQRVGPPKFIEERQRTRERERHIYIYRERDIYIERESERGIGSDSGEVATKLPSV